MTESPGAPLPSQGDKAVSAVLGSSILAPVYIAIILIGYLIFHSGAATVNGNELSRERSLFASVNAATLTGFAQSTNVNDYTPVGQATTAGLMTAGALFTLIAGGTAVRRIAGLAYTDRTLAITAALGVALATGIGAVGLNGDGRGAVGGAFDGLSAFANCGLYLRALPADNARPVYLVLLPLTIVGGLGIPVLLEIFHATFRRSVMSMHSRTVLTWSAAIYVAGFVLLLTMQLLALLSPTVPGDQWRHAVSGASTLSINARTAGFPFTFATEWSRALQWCVMGLMLIGAAPGGTAGGLKVTTVASLLGAAVRPLHTSDQSRLAVAVRWTLIYLGILAVSLLALLASEPQIPADRVLFLAISALGNVGMSHDPVVLSDVGWWVLSGVMLLGRFAPILMLWWMVDSRVETGIAIG